MADAVSSPQVSKARSKLGKAWETRDYESFLAEVRLRTWQWDTCHMWAQKQKKGYPLVKIAGRWKPVHRLVAEAQAGQPLGALSAHHACGRSLCVNPDHLGSVTHAENVGEMLARRSYLARIEELESAVRAMAPDHEVLNRVAA
ncbi:hypothetical protein ACFRAQ_34940 [Nocardia sp. NPDC056611]|uniref:hypothetical protein n=1 Tax=Nocardia sp. NPDC056611 TaxID=3345877 RepID=UPI00367345B3